MFLFTERNSSIDGAVNRVSCICRANAISKLSSRSSQGWMANFCAVTAKPTWIMEKKHWNFRRLIPPRGWRNYRNITKSKQIFKIFLKYAAYIRCRSSSLFLSAPFEWWNDSNRRFGAQQLGRSFASDRIYCRSHWPYFAPHFCRMHTAIFQHQNISGKLARFISFDLSLFGIVAWTTKPSQTHVRSLDWTRLMPIFLVLDAIASKMVLHFAAFFIKLIEFME